MSSIINLTDFSVKAEERIVSSASLEIYSQERLAIFGPGGSGKSLLLKFINGVHEPNLNYSYKSFEKEDGITFFLDLNNKAAREVAKTPKPGFDFYLIDEPENGYELDEFIGFSKKAKENDGTLLFVTHHLDFLEEVADRILVLKYGEQVGIYSKESFFDNEDPYIKYISKMGC